MKKLVLIILLAALFVIPGCTILEQFAGTAQPSEAPFEVPTAEPTAEPTAQVTPSPTPEPTEAPTEEPTEVPTEEPSPTPIVTSEYKSRVNILNLRKEPNTESLVVAKIGFEDRVTVVEPAEGEFYTVLYNGETCYCYSRFLVPAEEELYGYLSPRYEYKTDEEGNIVFAEDGVTPITLKSELIDIRLLIKDIEIYQIFGTDQNFTGEALYSRPVPVLQMDTAKKLAKAAERFAEDGYKIKLYDCYRPKSVQYILYDIVQNSAYIADPYKSASNHNRAAAVDITLIGPDGEELDFPSPMHTFTKLVYRSSRGEWTQEQRKNVDYMTDVMLECGFKYINTEWWHFSDVDYLDYIVLDIDMKDIPMYTARQLGFAAH